MKILCMSDEGIGPQIFREAAAEAFLKEDVAVEYIDEYGQEGLHMIETQGVSSVPIPKGFYKHTDAEIIIGSMLCPFSKEIISMFPKLRIIGTCRAGLENIDMEAVREREIVVVNGAGRNAEAVSDFTMALMLSEIRNVARSFRSITTNYEVWRSKWVNEAYVPHLRDCKVGIVGLGHIGRLVAKKVQGFGSKVLCYDPFVSDETMESLGLIRADLETLFKESDIISVHMRLVEATRGLINAELIGLMKPTAVFVNTARAGLADYDALLDALVNHRIGGAALDVFPEEPLPADSPWRRLDNCTITEHMAGGVPAARTYAAHLVAAAAAAAINGQVTPQLVTREQIQAEDFRTWAQTAWNK